MLLQVQHAVYAAGAVQPAAADEDLTPAAAPSVHLRHAGLSPPPAPRQQQQQEGRGWAAPGAGTTPERSRVPLSVVAASSLVMSLMSCLGVLPFFFVRRLSKPWAGMANAIASGVMLAASFGLLADAGPAAGGLLISGMLAGVAFVKLSQAHLERCGADVCAACLTCCC